MNSFFIDLYLQDQFVTTENISGLKVDKHNEGTHVTTYCSEILTNILVHLGETKAQYKVSDTNRFHIHTKIPTF